jgi:hypothetical protein
LKIGGVDVLSPSNWEFSALAAQIGCGLFICAGRQPYFEK